MPFTSQFEMSDSFLVNNFSFLFLLFSLSMVSVLVFYVLYKIAMRKAEKNKTALSEEEEEEGKKSEVRSQRKMLIDSQK